MAQLNQERLNHEANGNFLEAASLKEKIERLGQDLERRRIQDINQKQQAEREKIEAAFKQEMANFENFWTKKINEYDASTKTMLDTTRERQREDLGKKEVQLKEQMPKIDRMTPEVLNVMYQIEKLAKDQRYHEAHNLKKKLERLQNDALQRNEGVADKRIRTLLENFIKTQETEFKNLQLKLESGREEMLKTREIDYRRIVSKYRVYRENLEDNQALTKQRLQKELKSFKPSSNFLSKSIQGPAGVEQQ